ncbi:MAG: putative sulfate exporter family transporter [Nitrospirae bacterium]|nr:putative sulfate exporter family transporter [Nitrospirota bacterium]
MKSCNCHGYFKSVSAGLILAVFVGMSAYMLKIFTQTPILDPLLVALLLGVMVKAATGKLDKLKPGLLSATAIFIPVGIIFYAANNLNFAKLLEVEKSMIAVLIVVMLVYFAVILLLGRLFKQKKQVTYLIATGSAVCGASAIAVTAPAVDAEPDDVSVSLLSVALAAFVGFAIILPFLSSLFDLTCKTHCLLSGSVLQFTGMVKASNEFVNYLKHDMEHPETVQLALSVKSIRYLALLITVPLFASLVKRKFYIPWFLWAFLAAALLGTWFYVSNGSFYKSVLTPYIRPIHEISWSIAMAAIGLNADAKELLSNTGSKAILMAFGGFFAATAAFLIGFYFFVY